MKRLRPFFPYYGSKWRLAPRYPAPRHRRLVEPFAGSAGYAVFHHAHEVELYDLNPAVVGVWQYLLRVSERELRRLPDRVERVDVMPLPQEARWLIGFWANTAQVYPARAPSSWARSGRWPGKFWGAHVRDRLAMQLRFIRHWKVFHRSWEEISLGSATWFVDPPYRGLQGDHYRAFRLGEDTYPRIARWCSTLPGQVLVCESAGASWLPFRFFADAAALRGRSAEALWTREDPC